VPPGSNLPVRLTGRALASTGAYGPSTSLRVARQTERALNRLDQQSVVAQEVVYARARLIETATRAALQSSASIWSEAELLAIVAPSATQALQQIANASTIGLVNVVFDASR
jgi:hypothetical protein